MTNANELSVEHHGFMGGMKHPPVGWGRAEIVSCESQQRLELVNNRTELDEIYFAIRIKGDSEDTQLEVQAKAWDMRDRKHSITIAGVLTRNGHTVAYWARVDMVHRGGEIRMSDAGFQSIGFAQERISAF